MDTPTLEEQNAALRSLLKEFRDFVLSAVRMWSAKHVDPSHVNPIWARVAEAIEPPAAPAPETDGISLSAIIPLTGTIKEASIVERVIYGKLYNDLRGRFPDGSEIHTSRVAGIRRNGQFVTTSGSTYRVEFDRRSPQPFDLPYVDDADILRWRAGLV